jgi:hypothetical protein
MKESYYNQSDDHGATAAMLMNPYYAITLYPGLFGEHPPLTSEVQWVKANLRLITNLAPRRTCANCSSYSKATTRINLMTFLASSRRTW